VIRRLVWLTVGATAGALVTLYTLAGIRRARTGLDPHNAPERVARRAAAARGRVRAAIDEGRRTRRQYEERATPRSRRPLAS
jgi:hypothetical protein